MGSCDDTRTVALTVQGRAPKMGQSRRARWRAAVLVLVHVLIVAHVIQWLIVGMTVSPVEPSESMETLEFGAVNAGAVMFLIALVSTAVFGRFFCGWLCHVVALQDLCAWMMVRCGVRPKPFRSRLMVWFPLGLGLYMFVWPSFKRWVMAPGFEMMGWDWPLVLGVVPGSARLHNAFLVEDFWATFPAWYIAIPFLLLIGFGVVYVLGAKGFCTYGCPYGGFFAPLDKVAPVRIVVDDSCAQCGYCTSVCTSNVRVSEEVRDYGVVVDPGCMKTLDCVASCPNEALSIGLGGPSLFKKPRDPESAADSAAKRERRYDMSRRGEWVVALWAFFVFVSVRGALDQVPMLMAAGVAGMSGAGAVFVYRVLTRKDAKMQGFVLKRRGRVRVWGWALLGVMLVSTVFAAWAGQANYFRWRAGLVYASMDIPASFVLRRQYMTDPATEARAEQGIRLYELADSFSMGGFGWRLNAEERIELAYFRALVRDYDGAIADLTRAIEDGSPAGSLVIQRGQLMVRNGGGFEEIRENNASALALHPRLHLMRSELAKSAASIGETDVAEAYWEEAPVEDGFGWTLAQASYAGFIRDAERARALIEEARAIAEEARVGKSEMLMQVAGTSRGAGLLEVERELMGLAIDADPENYRVLISGAEVAFGSGDQAAAVERLERAEAVGFDEDPEALRRAAVVYTQLGDLERASGHLKTALAAAEQDLSRRSIGEWMVRVGAQFGDEALVNEGVEVWGSVVEERADLSVLGIDFAGILVRLGRVEEAKAAAVRAGEQDDRNTAIAVWVANFMGEIGDMEGFERWSEIAAAREAAESGSGAGDGSDEEADGP